jgi:putative heme-binding domain-containing protein
MTKSGIGWIAVLFSCLCQTSAVDWVKVPVPGRHDFKGYGWYRTWFKPPQRFFAKHERDLWGESVIFNVRGLAGAHEVYVNGKRIGGGGTFPPEFEDGRKGNHQHKVPSGSLVPEAWNQLAVRVYAPDGGGGFLGEAPFLMNYFLECVFDGPWEFRPGDARVSFDGVLDRRPSGSAFDQFRESNRVLAEAERFVHGRKLPPLDSFRKMKAADDLVVDLMLAEPLVAQPTHFSFDSRGRLWVSQFRQYPFPAGLEMISRDRYYRSHYDKVPPAPPRHDRGRDLISIHEDTTGDGRYDRHKVFRDGLNMANAALRGRGGVWVMHTPYLLFYPDRDFDDVPDGPPAVHLQGFGLEDTHSIANGLAWGMDGWLYGTQGSTTACHVTRPGIDPPDAPAVYYQGCMVWRYHPETRRFELFSQGGGNNFGLEVDGAGRLFTGHNGGQTRGWHFLQGGMHLMQGTTPNKFGPPRNPFSFGDLPKMVSEQDIRRFTHFGAVVEATAIPGKYQDSFFSVDPLHNFVIASRRIRAGATFKTSDLGKVLTSGDFAFRPVFIGNAPDGSVLIGDFYNHYIAHGQHYQSQIDPGTGRIFRLRGKQEPLERDLDLRAKSSDRLLGLLKHPNRWHRHTAVRLLGERKDPGSADRLRQLVGSGSDLQSLSALWALYQAFGLDQATALTALRHGTPMVRYWAVRLVCDDIGFANRRSTLGLADSLGELKGGPTRVPDRLFRALLEGAAGERDAEVRSQMAASARRLPVDQALPLVTALLRHDEDVEDPYLPLLSWWVLEANLDPERDAVMELFEDPEFRREPVVRRHILERVMRALALKGKSGDLEDCTRLLELAVDGEEQDSLLKGFELAYAGRRIGGLPDRLVRGLVESGRSSLELRVRLGDADASRAAVELLLSPEASLEERIAVARTLGEVRSADSVESLIRVSTAPEPPLQRAALAALSSFRDPGVGQQALARFSDYSDQARPAFFDLMLSRPVWTRQLIQAVSRGGLAPELVPDDVAERLRGDQDRKIAGLAREHLGSGEELDREAVRRRITRLRSMLADGTGNPYAGEAAYTRRCGSCHKLFHKGGSSGPDLTAYQRGDLGTLLISIVDPDAEIREGYEYVTLVTKEGRTLSGFLTDRDPQVVVLRGMAGEDIRVERRQVESIEPMGRSLMPARLLEGLNDQQLRDFFAYLRISQPISR